MKDTDVPDLAVDEESQEIRLDWRAIFSHSLAEEKRSLLPTSSKQHIDLLIKSLIHPVNSADKLQMSKFLGHQPRDKPDQAETNQLEATRAVSAITDRAFSRAGNRLVVLVSVVSAKWKDGTVDRAFDGGFQGKRKAGR